MSDVSDIRVILSDLDDTLFHRAARVTERNRRALAACRAAGYRFVVVTGRPRGRTPDDLPPHDAIVYNNGAEGWIGGERLFRHSISPETLREAIHTLRARFPLLNFAAETEDGLYADFEANSWWSHTPYTRVEDWDAALPTLPPVAKLSTFPRGVVRHMALSGEAEELYPNDEVRAAFPKSIWPFTMLEGALVQSVAEGVDKASGAGRVLERWGLTMKNAVAFGDDGNDTPMLEAAGIGVAVANAFPEVLARADETTGRNVDDGVALWLERNLLRAKR